MADENTGIEPAEFPKDVGCLTIEKHKEHYSKSLTPFLSRDPASVVVDFLVWGALKKGHLIDVQWSSCPKWWVGLVLDERADAETGEQEVYIYYVGWTAQWREWVKRDSGKLQPYGLHTRGLIHIGGRMRSQGTTEVTPFEDLDIGTSVIHQAFIGQIQAITGTHYVLALSNGQREYVRRSDPSSLRKLLMSDDCRGWECSCGTRHAQTAFYCSCCGRGYYQNVLDQMAARNTGNRRVMTQ